MCASVHEQACVHVSEHAYQQKCVAIHHFAALVLRKCAFLPLEQISMGSKITKQKENLNGRK